MLRKGRDTALEEILVASGERAAREAARKTSRTLETETVSQLAVAEETVGFPDRPRVQSETPLKRNFEPPTELKRSEVIGRAEIIQQVQEHFDVLIRVGRYPFAQTKTLGVFKHDPEVVRLRFANDVETAAHEVGHFLSKKVFRDTFRGAKLSAIAKAELQKMGHDLYGSRKPTGGYGEEGLAEFVKFYVRDPAEVQAKAPRFLEYFENTIAGKFPDVRDTLLKMRDDYRRYREQPASARVLSQISTDEGKPRAWSFGQLYTNVLDDLHPLKVFTDTMKKGGDPILVSKDPYVLSRLHRGWMAKADLFLKDGTFDPNTLQKTGKSLNEILLRVADRLDDFRSYLVAKRAEELHARGKQTGISPEDAAATIKEQDSPAFRKAQEDLQLYNRFLLSYLKERGVISDVAFNKIIELNKDYVPFYRLVEDSESGSMAGGGRTFANLFQPVKKLKGSTRPILDPLESTIKNTYAYINVAERNAVGKAIVDLAEGRPGAGKFVERVQTPQTATRLRQSEIETILKEAGVDPREVDSDTASLVINVFRPAHNAPRIDNIVTIWQNGKKVFYQLAPDLYRAVNALDREGSSLLVKILSIPAQTLRLGATALSPEFAARNLPRDIATAFITKGIGPGDVARGIFHAINKDEMYRLWRASGAEFSTFHGMDRAALRKTLRDVVTGRGPKDVVSHMMRHPIDSLRILADITEKATRLAVFTKYLPEGTAAPRGSLLNAALQSREATVDFARQGAKMQAVSSITAFLNPSLQGLDLMVRSLMENPVGVSTRIAAGIVLPSILLYLANRDDPRYWELPNWQRDLFWPIPTGSMDSKTWESMSDKEKAEFASDHPIWRIPKPFDVGLLFGTGSERILEWIDKSDPKALTDLLSSMKGMWPNIVPTFASPLIENWSNYSSFRERPIVSQGKERVAPSEQFGPYTPESAKALGKWFNYSPAKIENLIRGYFGTVGGWAMEAADVAIGRAERPSQGLSGVPIVRGLVARFPGQPQSIEDFYDRYEKATEARATYNLILRQGRRTEAREYRQEHSEELAMAPRLATVARVMGTLRQRMDMIRASNRSPEEKRRELDAITFRMATLAKAGLGKREHREQGRQFAPGFDVEFQPLESEIQ